MGSVLKNRSLVLIAISEAISNVGSWVTMMAIFGLVIFRGEGNVTQSGLIYLAGLLPSLLFSPIAGWLCDHFDRKKLMIMSEILSGLAVSGIIFTESIELLYVLLAIQAMTSSIMTPARQSSVPMLVEREQLTQANALLQQLSSVVKIFGPILAGAVLAIMNPHQAVILDVISYFISGGLLFLLPKLLPPQQKKEENQGLGRKQKWLNSMNEFLHLDNQLKLLFGMAFMAILGITSVDILASIFTRDILQGGESFFGLVIGIIGFGTLTGSAILMLSKRESRPWEDVIGGMVLMAVLPAAMAIGYHMNNMILARGLTVLVCLLAGYGMGRKMVQDSTLLQTLSPPNILGRVSGLYQSIIIAAQLFGTLLTSAVVPALMPAKTYFILVTLLILSVALFGLAYLRKTRYNQISIVNSKQE